MSPAVKSVLRRGTSLWSLRRALNMAAVLGVVPFSLQEQIVVFGKWKLPYNIFCTFAIPSLGCCALIFPNPLLDNSSFFIFVFMLQYVPFCFTLFAFLFCHIYYHGDIASTILQLLRIERMFLPLNTEPKIQYGILKEAIMPLLLVCCSIVLLITFRISAFASLALFMTLQYANLYFFIMESLIIFFLSTVQQYLGTLVLGLSSREKVLIQLCIIQDKLADVTASIQKVYGFPVLCMALSNFCFINGEEFCTQLYRIVKKDKSYKLLNNKYLRAHLLKKKSFSFNLAGFAEVDMKFVAGVISATATYSILLIQMGKNA